VATIATVIGDRARATMLRYLMDGRSLTATELARGAQVTKQTASAHLSKLADARLIAAERVGRHRYFRLADPTVAATLEQLVGLAARAGLTDIETGPTDPAMRKARVCYDHLAGELAVRLFDSFVERDLVKVHGSTIALTVDGEAFVERQGIDVAAHRASR